LVPPTTSLQPAPVRRWHAAIIVGLVISLAIGAAAFGWWFARESPAHQGPIVLISVDGLSGADMATYGASPGRTPAMDALASDGVVFERAYTHSPQILPAHVSLLTGQFPPAHGVRHDVGFVLPLEARTLAELLRSRGFATGGAVSSLLLRRETGIDQGFGFFDADIPEASADQPRAVARGARDTFDAAARWMGLQSGQRYFLLLQIPRADADAVIGDAVAWLKQRRLYDGATVVLVGSRGDTGNGLSLDEATLRVPLIVKQPDREGAGARIAPPVQHADVLPTILDLVRAPLPSGIPGRSLRPVLDDPTEPVPARLVFGESLVAHYVLGGRPTMAVSNERHRLVRDDGEPDTGETLVPIDPPGPRVPGADNPDATPLRAALAGMLKGTRVVAPTRAQRTDRKLIALLGYLDGPRSMPTGDLAVEPAAQATAVEALHRAARLVGADRLDDAIRALQPVASAQPSLALVQYQLAALLARGGRLGEAAVAFRRAEAAAPEHAEFATAVAETLRRAGRLGDARKQVEIAVMRAEAGTAIDRADAHEVAARIALAQKDAEAAARHALLAYEADQARPVPAFVTGRLAASDSRFEDAVAAFSGAVQALVPGGPRLAELHQSYGDALVRLDRYADAEAQFRLEVSAFPDTPAAYVSLATLYRATTRDADIDGVVAQLLEAVPTPDGYATAIRLWTVLGNRARATALRAEALRRFPVETRALRERAPRR
jgi:tetratricopeptide (TPR) repeat protein